MSVPDLSDRDLRQIEAHGLDADEVRRQLALFRDPPAPVRLARPATAGDGILRLEGPERGGLLAAFEAAAREGRALKLVPASGAASRMFQSLQAARERDPVLLAGRVQERADGGDGPSRDVERFVEDLARLPFRDELEAVLLARGVTYGSCIASGRWGQILDALLSERGLDLPSRPKGLLPFHLYGDAYRTPFEEHLVEASRVVRDASGRARAHFTVAGEHRTAFEAVLASRRSELEESLDTALEVGFSEQSPATDTLAADAHGRPFRDRDGSLVFRPGGHGALLPNLERLGGDLVHVKNIDNVPHGRLAEEGILWKKLLVGLLARLLEESRAHQRALRVPEPARADLDAALTFLTSRFGGRAPSASATRDEVREHVLLRLDRPMRVCGVVRNAGEPGGGPFWVRGAGGEESLQIVEASQIDRKDPGQEAALKASTHFNPVDLVCALKAADGRAYPLASFVDASTVFLSKKSKDGRELLALERPGLWNGAMAGWLTVFLEVPLSTFTPVKTVLDLLRPEHQEEPEPDED